MLFISFPGGRNPLKPRKKLVIIHASTNSPKKPKRVIVGVPFRKTVESPIATTTYDGVRPLKSMRRLHRLRLRRMKAIIREWKLLPKWPIGILIGGELAKNPSFREGISVMAGFAGYIGSLYWLKHAPKYKEKIARANEQLAKSLHYGAIRNEAIADFLRQWKYIYVDKTGELVGTNWNIPLLPRYLRLNTQKILEGKFQFPKKKSK